MIDLGSHILENSFEDWEETLIKVREFIPLIKNPDCIHLSNGEIFVAIAEINPGEYCLRGCKTADDIEEVRNNYQEIRWYRKSTLAYRGSSYL